MKQEVCLIPYFGQFISKNYKFKHIPDYTIDYEEYFKILAEEEEFRQMQKKLKHGSE